MVLSAWEEVIVVVGVAVVVEVRVVAVQEALA